MNLKNTALGIELGSTRIKAVLIGPDHEVLATGGHAWENHLEGGLWSYTLDEAVAGLPARACLAGLRIAAIAALPSPGLVRGGNLAGGLAQTLHPLGGLDELHPSVVDRRRRHDCG